MEPTNKPNETPDLLSAILSVQVRNEEKISDADRAYCEQQQSRVNAILDELEKWHGILVEDAQRLTDLYRITYQPNGSVDHFEQDYGRPYQTKLEEYQNCRFIPFGIINKIVEKVYQANLTFKHNIISYFNGQYGLSVPSPVLNENDMRMNARPSYLSYVDHVIEYLGGRSFREVAVEELMKRYHDSANYHSRNNPPALQGNKIIISNVVSFSEYITHKLYQDSRTYASLSSVVAGIVYAVTDSINGNSSFIEDFDEDNIDLSKWYRLYLPTGVYLKFYKNGRIDVKFDEKGAAEKAFRKLEPHVSDNYDTDHR